MICYAHSASHRTIEHQYSFDAETHLKDNHVTLKIYGIIVFLNSLVIRADNNILPFLIRRAWSLINTFSVEMFRLPMPQRGSWLSEPLLNTMEGAGTPIANFQNKTPIAFRKIKPILLFMLDDLIWRRRRIDLKIMFIRTENAL